MDTVNEGNRGREGQKAQGSRYAEEGSARHDSYDGVWRICRRMGKEWLAALHPRKRREKAVWLAGEGVEFLKGIGLRAGDTMIDFGAGAGHYTIPAAQLAGNSGRVIAVERRQDVFRQLRRNAAAAGLYNVSTVESARDVPEVLGGHRARAILFYDALQFMDAEERVDVYRRSHAWLVPDGFLSVYPKHTEGDEPDRHFRHMTVEDVCREIEAAGYGMDGCATANLWHGHGRATGTVWKFRKRVSGRQKI